MKHSPIQVVYDKFAVEQMVHTNRQPFAIYQDVLEASGTELSSREYRPKLAEGLKLEHVSNTFYVRISHLIILNCILSRRRSGNVDLA